MRRTGKRWLKAYIVSAGPFSGHHIYADNSVRTPIAVVPETIGGKKNSQGRSPYQVANAALITEAPALLDGLKWALQQMRGDSGTGHSHWAQYKEYRDAVAAVRRTGARK